MPLAAAMLTPSAKQGKGTTLLLVLLLQRITEMLAVELALPRFDDGGSVYCNVFFTKAKSTQFYLLQ